MQFKEKQSIYQQIAEYMYEQVLGGKWPDDTRIPSIRDMAVQMEVNPNTITRTYTLLQDQGIIYNQRGIGYFTTAHASEVARVQKKQEFIQTFLPEVFKTMASLNMPVEELEALYRDYMTQNKGRLYENK
ncbi:MAG: GntR family transcriptional regulator [Spirochaetia bacterium]|nr:GntR family transcriptional regulator [Spirochaetia bacterium]